MNPWKTAASVEWATLGYAAARPAEAIGLESAVGPGKENADTGFVSPDRTFGFVADGVGSSGADILSAGIVDELLRMRLAERTQQADRAELTETFSRVAEEMHDLLARQSELTGQPHEAVAAWYGLVEEDGKTRAVIASVGDCQVHRTRRGRTKQLTRRDLPRRTKRPALGRKRHRPDIRTVTLKPGDSLTIASNGIRKNLKPKRIRNILGSAGSASETATRLVRAARRRSRSRDAATALVVDV